MNKSNLFGASQNENDASKSFISKVGQDFQETGLEDDAEYEYIYEEEEEENEAEDI